MEYLVNEKRYSFDYKDTKAQYENYCALSDWDFKQRLPEILHFACFVSYVKGLGIESTLSDEGIIHQLVHLLSIEDPIIDLNEIRIQFENLLRLS